MKINFKAVFLFLALFPSFAWANAQCEQLSVIAEDTMRQRQAGADFFEVIKPVIDGYVSRVKSANNLTEVKAVTESFEQVFAIAKVANETEVETDGKFQNEAIYSFSQKIKALCLEHKP